MMMRVKVIVLCVLVLTEMIAVGVCGGKLIASDKAARRGKVAAKPLFRDPVYDGAITCDRDEPTRVLLRAPSDKK